MDDKEVIKLLLQQNAMLKALLEQKEPNQSAKRTATQLAKKIRADYQGAFSRKWNTKPQKR